MNIPKTSTTLLRQLAADSRHARWAEFVSRYRPMMEDFMRSRFPSVEADDAISETFIALVDALRNYRYNPSEMGHFRNYLTGILRHRALRAVRSDERRARLVSGWDPTAPTEDTAWRDSMFEIALQMFFDDDTIHPRTKEIFRRVAVNHESPAAVAESLAMPLNTVNKGKSRAVARLREIVANLRAADER